MKTNLLIKAVALSLICFSFIRCSVGNNMNEFGSITVYDQSKLELTFTSAADTETFEFTTEGSWTAISSDPEWIVASPSSGEAGEAMLEISIAKNDAAQAKERNGKVEIICQDSKVTIYIRQKA